jgi:hypothetical protein
MSPADVNEKIIQTGIAADAVTAKRLKAAGYA